MRRCADWLMALRLLVGLCAAPRLGVMAAPDQEAAGTDSRQACSPARRHRLLVRASRMQTGGSRRHCAVPFIDPEAEGHDNTTYGHIWNALYSFFLKHISREDNDPVRHRCDTYLIPAFNHFENQLVYSELQTLLDSYTGPRVNRTAWVPVCYEQTDPCCSASRASIGIFPLHVRKVHQTATLNLELRSHVFSVGCGP